MKVFQFIFLVLYLVIPLNLLPQERGLPVIKNYTTQEYNGAPQVFGITQDNRGVMYFACGSTIQEFDGVTWRSIPNKNQKTFIDFAKDKNGRIYVTAVDDFGVIKFDSSGNSYFHSLANLITDTIKLGFVWSVKLTANMAFFLTYDAIIQYCPENDNILVISAKPDDGFLDGFVFNNELYVQYEKGGLVKFVDGKLEQANASSFFEEKNYFRTALPFDSSTLLVPTRTEGLLLYQPNKNSFPEKFTISNSQFLQNNNIFIANVVSSQYYVLGSVNKGAVLLDKGGSILQHYQESNLQSNTIRSIFQDKNHNIWFGLENGISKSENSLDLSFWDKNSGLKGSVYSVIRFNGRVYIATSVKLYFIDESNEIKEVQNIPVGHNWCFMVFNSSKLLAGSRYGIYEISGDSASLIHEETHAAKLFQSRKNPNRIFSSVLPYFTSLRYENGKWIYEGRWEGINDQIRGIVEDENGDLWLGTYRDGVIRVTPNYDNITQPKQVRYYNQNHGFESLSDILPFQLNNRIVWGSGNGLYEYNPQTDRFEPYRELGDEFCNGSRSVFSLQQMPDGKIWICPKENKIDDIGYLQPNANGEYSWNYVPFRRIPEMVIESFYVEPSGIAWVGGSNGLFRYDLTEDRKDYSQPFNCLVRNVTVNSDSLLYGGNYSEQSSETLSLSYKQNNVKFEFAAPFFDQEDKTLYSYKLNGFDTEWSQYSKQTSKEYNSLREGEYVFEVKARNLFDVESQVASFSFEIRPPWYRTIWAIFLYFGIVVAFLWIFSRINSRRLKLANLELEAIVNERTSTVQAQAKELDSTLKTLKETQKKLIRSEKLASLGVLAAGVAHEINNPLNFIQGGIHGIDKYVSEKLGEHKSSIDYYLNWIVEGVKRAETIVAGLNHFNRTDAITSEIKNIHSIIDGSLFMLQHALENRIEVTKDYTTKNFTIVGNESNLYKVFYNVLSNAIHAIDGTGQIKIATMLDDSVFRIVITDSGCGISEKDMLKVFDPFFTTKPPGKGIGLGLTIAYNILQEHIGTIELTSEEGKGTSAVITLPVKQ